MRRNGFTLIEVLVTIGIILVLAGLMFSGARSALEASRATVCISNLRQIHTALNLYKVDHDDYPPRSEVWTHLSPYAKKEDFSCPMARMANPGIPVQHIFDYMVSVNAGAELSWFAQLTADEACRQQRGPDYPIAYDRNHAHPMSAQRAGGEAFYLILRDGGSVTRKSAAGVNGPDRSKWPCPSAHFWSNF